MTTSDTQLLWRFSFACQQAKTLMDTDQVHSLCVLDFPEVQRKVIGRLDTSLQSKWGSHVFRVYDDDSKVPFKDFSAWVAKLAERHSSPNLKFSDETTVRPSKDLHKPVAQSYQSPFPKAGFPLPPHKTFPSATYKPNSAGRDPKGNVMSSAAEQEDQPEVTLRSHFSRSEFSSSEYCFSSRAILASTYGPTIPVHLTHPSCPEKIIQGLALIDNQSTSTWIDGAVDALLRVDPRFVSQEKIKLTTMDRINAEHQGRMITGLQIAPYHKTTDVLWQFTELPEWHERYITPVATKVASVEDVRDMAPSVAQFNENFPERRPAWETLILIGRDCLWAMQQETVNDDDGLIVSRTPLGWTLVGPMLTRNRIPHEYTSGNGGQTVQLVDSKPQSPQRNNKDRIRNGRGCLRAAPVTGAENSAIMPDIVEIKWKRKVPVVSLMLYGGSRWRTEAPPRRSWIA